MKKGKLYKEGKTWKIDSSELKTSPIAVLGDFGLSDSMSGEEIEFDHSGGPVNLIRHAGKEYRKKAWGESASPARDQRGSYQQRDQRHAYGGGQPQKQKRDPAFAPYNFIPLPNSFAPGQPTVGFDSFNETQEGRLSGYIALDIINNSPLFIRGNGEQSFQLKEGVILQGSSLRGMVRSYVELVSRGKFKAGQHFDDKRFYNRAMADMAINLREKYKEEMLEGIEAGYLSYCKKDRTYSITPAIGFDRVNNYLEFKYVKKHNGYEVHSGKIKGKKYNKLVLEPSTESPMPVSAKLIESYEADSNRSSKVNDILLLARKGKGNGVEFPNGVPMFFKRDSNNKILSFGHTRYYRYPYDLTVANHVPLNLQQGKEEDIPDTIFGRPGSENIPEKAGKVFFEDTTPVPYSQVASQLVILNNLGSPKPTTFQHYLIN